MLTLKNKIKLNNKNQIDVSIFTIVFYACYHFRFMADLLDAMNRNDENREQMEWYISETQGQFHYENKQSRINDEQNKW